MKITITKEQMKKLKNMAKLVKKMKTYNKNLKSIEIRHYNNKIVATITNSFWLVSIEIGEKTHYCESTKFEPFVFDYNFFLTLDTSKKATKELILNTEEKRFEYGSLLVEDYNNIKFPNWPMIIDQIIEDTSNPINCMNSTMSEPLSIFDPITTFTIKNYKPNYMLQTTSYDFILIGGR